MKTRSQQEIKIFQVTDTTLPKGRARLLQTDLYSMLQIDLLQIAVGQVKKEPLHLQLHRAQWQRLQGPRAEQRSEEP